MGTLMFCFLLAHLFTGWSEWGGDEDEEENGGRVEEGEKIWEVGGFEKGGKVGEEVGGEDEVKGEMREPNSTRRRTAES